MGFVPCHRPNHPCPPGLSRTSRKVRGDWQHQCPPRLVLQEFAWVFFQVRAMSGCPLEHSWMPPCLQPKSTNQKAPRRRPGRAFRGGKTLLIPHPQGARDEGWAEDASKPFEKERNSSASTGGQRAPGSSTKPAACQFPEVGAVTKEDPPPPARWLSLVPCSQDTGSVTHFPGRFFPFRTGQGFIYNRPLPRWV